MSENPNPEFREQPEPEVNERPEPEFPNQRIVLPNTRRDPAFYLALALAAFCILGAISTTAFFAGFFTGSSMNSGSSYASATLSKQTAYYNQQGNPMKSRGSWVNQPPQANIVAKVGIVQGPDGLQFSMPAVKLPHGSAFVLINTTDQMQSLVSNTGMRSINVAPNQAVTMFMGGPNVNVLRLAANPDATLTVYTGCR
ncbi:MAG TPA: hypothetical protein VL485_15570 [Ktedonobacteraceae bacterium]|nr:hypothetical protein [Ktedonobacteraceae bacterium]